MRMLRGKIQSKNQHWQDHAGYRSVQILANGSLLQGSVADLVFSQAADMPSAIESAF
jgi:hypothetical protein